MNRAILCALLVVPPPALVGFAQNQPHYTSNKRSDAECGSYTPSPTQISFACKEVSRGSGPPEVVFSMKNTSGCKVAERAVGKVTGSNGHIYQTNPAGASGQLWNRTNGYLDNDIRTPFKRVLPPNKAEEPVSCEIVDIEVCSTTPPPGFQAGAAFRPFLDGRCARFNSVGPIYLGRHQAACGDPQKGASLDWAAAWADEGRLCPAKPYACQPEERSVQLIDGGILAHKYQAAAVTSKGTDDTTIPFAAIGSVALMPKIDGRATVAGADLYPLNIGPTATGTFPEHQSGGYNDGDYQSHGFLFYFASEDAARQAYDFFEYHRCLGK